MHCPVLGHVTVRFFCTPPSDNEKLEAVNPPTNAPAESLTVTGSRFRVGQLLLSSVPIVTARSFTGVVPPPPPVIVTWIVPVFGAVMSKAASAMKYVPARSPGDPDNPIRKSLALFSSVLWSATTVPAELICASVPNRAYNSISEVVINRSRNSVAPCGTRTRYPKSPLNKVGRVISGSVKFTLDPLTSSVGACRPSMLVSRIDPSPVIFLCPSAPIIRLACASTNTNIFAERMATSSIPGSFTP
jgi:hypothetical protein